MKMIRECNKALEVSVLTVCLASCGRVVQTDTPGQEALSVRHRSVYEVALQSRTRQGSFAGDCSVVFRLPSGMKTAVAAFWDGGQTWRARAYVSEAGRWQWESISTVNPELNGRSGSFDALPSNLRGMLRAHRTNPRQWMTDDGTWFLNLSDTANILSSKEALWREYVHDAWENGITLIHAGSLGGEDWDPEPDWRSRLLRDLRHTNALYSNFPWTDRSYSAPELEKFQETDRRLQWLIEKYPGMYLQVVLFGIKAWAEDQQWQAWEEVPPNRRREMMDYMIARWAAFPNVIWEVVNDLHAGAGFPGNHRFVREVGTYFKQHDPWHHLLSAGANRGAEFPYLSAADGWVSYIHLQAEYELNADAARRYRSYPLHVFLGEDRFEQDRATRDPLHPDYYYRRLFWSWLLSGGSANYGGRWRHVHPYSRTGGLAYVAGWNKPDAFETSQQLHGLDSVRHIKKYFGDRQIDLAQYAVFEGAVDVDRPLRLPAMWREEQEYIIYHPNAQSDGRKAEVDVRHTPEVRLDLSQTRKVFSAE